MVTSVNAVIRPPVGGAVGGGVSVVIHTPELRCSICGKGGGGG